MERQKLMLILKGTHRAIFVLSLGVFVFSGCTKSVPYDEVYKYQVYSKNNVDTQSEYLFTASMANASSDDENARPFWFAESKRVKLSILEKQLRVEETVLDQRFDANDGNKKVVLEIPIKHVEYECVKNSFGECTNKEGENNKIDWSQKQNFTIDLADTKASQFEILPILMEKDQTMGFCYREISSRVLSQDISGDAINFQLEKNYKNLCTAARTTSNTNVKAVFHYSLVKVSSVLSKDFVPRIYPDKDENTFGYFYTERFPRDIDKNETESGRLALRNHWNPSRKVIDYHLSDEFNKPENKNLKDLSYVAVDRVNKGLREAGASFQIVLHEPSGKVPGDIRNSMIVLVEDPYASGPLGYGPQTEDPVTGEIISARTIMYSGVFETIIKIYYEDLIRANMEETSTEVRLKRSKRATAELIASVQKQMQLDQREGRAIVDKATLSRVSTEKINNRKTLDLTSSVLKNSNSQVGQEKKNGSISMVSVRAAEKSLRDYAKSKDKSFEYLTLLNRMSKGEVDYKGAKSEGQMTPAALTEMDVQERKLTYLRDVKNCAYTPSMNLAKGEVNHGKLKQLFKEKFKVNELKAWENMTRAEKRAVVNFFLEEMWVPTLVHELGHNMGLRHNFAGSEDKSNFPTEKELSAIQDDRKPVSSSVMDYVIDNVALKHMGKYDIAAFKYAYANKVELVEYSKDMATCAQKTTADGRNIIKRSYTVKNSETVRDLVAVLEMIEAKPLDDENQPCGAMKLPNLDKISQLLAKCETIRKNGQLVDIEDQDLALIRKCNVVADLKSSGLQEPQSWQGLEIKDYRYCTDESTGINAGCRRFDTGTTMTEIAQSLIESYNNRYWVRNLRRDRVDFSLFDDPSYASRTRSYFYDMRLMFESMERYKAMGFGYDSEVWKSIEFLKDLRSAAVLTGEKLLDVATTPAKYCLVAATDGSDQFVMPFEELSARFVGGRGIDCWDIESKDSRLPETYAIIAQTGKNFNSSKSVESENSYADQIDIRGYWMDKRAAVHMLTRRSMGVSTLDKGGDNYLDLPELRQKINDAFVAMISNEMKKVVTFELANGSKESIEFSFDTFEHNMIEKPIHPVIASWLGLTDAKQPLSQLMVSAIPYHMRDYIGKADSERTFVKQYIVAKYDATNLGNFTSEGKIFVDIGDSRFVAAPENTIATKLILDLKGKQEKFAKMAEVIPTLNAAKLQDADMDAIFAIKTQVNALMQKLTTAEEKEALLRTAVGIIRPQLKVELTVVTEDQLVAALKVLLVDGDQSIIKQVKTGISQYDFLTTDFSVKLLRMMPDRVL